MSLDRCSKIFETYPGADCILYDDEKCDGAEGIKVMKDGDKATNFEETYGFDVESISIKKGHKLTIYQGNINKIDVHSKIFLETVRREILLIFSIYHCRKFVERKI